MHQPVEVPLWACCHPVVGRGQVGSRWRGVRSGGLDSVLPTSEHSFWKGLSPLPFSFLFSALSLLVLSASSTEQLQCYLSPQSSSRVGATGEGGLPIPPLPPARAPPCLGRGRPGYRPPGQGETLYCLPAHVGDVNRRIFAHRVTEIMRSCSA